MENAVVTKNQSMTTTGFELRSQLAITCSKLTIETLE